MKRHDVTAEIGGKGKAATREFKGMTGGQAADLAEHLRDTKLKGDTVKVTKR